MKRLNELRDKVEREDAKAFGIIASWLLIMIGIFCILWAMIAFISG